MYENLNQVAAFFASNQPEMATLVDGVATIVEENAVRPRHYFVTLYYLGLDAEVTALVIDGVAEVGWPFYREFHGKEFVRGWTDRIKRDAIEIAYR